MTWWNPLAQMCAKGGVRGGFSGKILGIAYLIYSQNRNRPGFDILSQEVIRMGHHEFAGVSATTNDSPTIPAAQALLKALNRGKLRGTKLELFGWDGNEKNRPEDV